ncbi:MAG: hypothetical protein ABEH80_06255 [Halobaculum sp.]
MSRENTPRDERVEIAGEVTRVAAVRYLQGALGHGVGSLACLVVGWLLLAVGVQSVGSVLLVGAFALAANGASIAAWHRLRGLVQRRDSRQPRQPTRAITAHSLSTEQKADLVAGFVVVCGLVGGLAASVLLVRQFGVGTAAAVLSVAFGVGNVVALVRASPDGESTTTPSSSSRWPATS